MGLLMYSEIVSHLRFIKSHSLVKYRNTQIMVKNQNGLQTGGAKICQLSYDTVIRVLYI